MMNLTKKKSKKYTYQCLLSTLHNFLGIGQSRTEIKFNYIYCQLKIKRICSNLLSIHRKFRFLSYKFKKSQK